jgi:hypothetical protein
MVQPRGTAARRTTPEDAAAADSPEAPRGSPAALPRYAPPDAAVQMHHNAVQMHQARLAAAKRAGPKSPMLQDIVPGVERYRCPIVRLGSEERSSPCPALTRRRPAVPGLAAMDAEGGMTAREASLRR